MDKTSPIIFLLCLVMMLAECSESSKNFEIGHCLPADKVILPINLSEEAKAASSSLTYRCANNNHIYGSWYSDSNYDGNKSNNVSIQNNGSLVLYHPGTDSCATISVTLHVHEESKYAIDHLTSKLNRSGEAICENNTVPKNEDNNGIEEPTPGDDELPKKPPGETNTGAGIGTIVGIVIVLGLGLGLGALVVFLVYLRRRGRDLCTSLVSSTNKRDRHR